MLDERQCSFICLSYLGVIRDRRINVFFNPLCRLKWKSPCNQNSLNGLWMLGTDFCAWVQIWLGIYVGAIGSPSLAGETCPLQIVFAMWYVQFSSVSQSCLTLCNPVDCSMPGLTVLHQILELVETHVHRIGASIQPSHPLSSSLLLPSILPSNRVFSNELGLHISWPKVLEVQFQHQSFQWIVRIDFL